MTPIKDYISKALAPTTAAALALTEKAGAALTIESLNIYSSPLAGLSQTYTESLSYYSGIDVMGASAELGIILLGTTVAFVGTVATASAVKYYLEQRKKHKELLSLKS
jgi:hypothetical protein